MLDFHVTIFKQLKERLNPACISSTLPILPKDHGKCIATCRPKVADGWSFKWETMCYPRRISWEVGKVISKRPTRMSGFFFRIWYAMHSFLDYKVGFGDFDREFWLGNILIWALTNVSNSTRYELAIDMEDWSDNRRFARYRSFRVGSERDAFRLYHQNLYYGNAGDSLYSHNAMPFSTFDVDNDNRDGDFEESSCARLYKVHNSFVTACV